MYNVFIKHTLNINIILIAVLGSIFFIQGVVNNVSGLDTNKEQIQFSYPQTIRISDQGKNTSNFNNSSGVKGIVFHEGPGGREPYKGYKVEVFSENGTLVANTVTNDNGKYFVPLDPGRYVIPTQNGPSIYNIKKENHIIINKNQIIDQILIVDTGTRSLP